MLHAHNLSSCELIFGTYYLDLFRSRLYPSRTDFFEIVRYHFVMKVLVQNITCYNSTIHTICQLMLTNDIDDYDLRLKQNMI